MGELLQVEQTGLLRRAESIGFARSVGPNVVALATYLDAEQSDQAIGNVARGYCTNELGGAACKVLCMLRSPESGIADPQRANRAGCADDNLARALDRLDIPQAETIMAMVGSVDGVGFADDASVLRHHPDGRRELSGVNALFARRSEARALGARLADCGFIAVDMTDGTPGYVGESVMGLIHSSRTNLRGSQELAEYGGKRQTYIHFALESAMERYNADPSQVRVRLLAAVEQGYIKTFDSEQKMRSVFPGWQDDGFMHCLDRPDWQPGQPFDATDRWLPDYPGFTKRDILGAASDLDIPAENIAIDAPLDPSATPGRHSSHINTQRKIMNVESRDAYLVVAR